MKLNNISLTELTNQIRRLGKPIKAGQKKEFYLAGHHITVESDMKKECFNLEWKIIEIK